MPPGRSLSDDFEYREVDIPEPGDGQFLMKTLYLNLAPVMRMYMSGESVAGEKPLAIGDVIHGRGVAEIVASNHPDYAVGEIVQGQTGWQTYKVSSGTPGERIRRIRDHGVPYSIGLSTFGMTGFSAYFGFFDCGQPGEGDVVVVSGAAGGVGSHVVQLAKILDCRVIGIAGGREKCRFVESLGCDVSLDYKAGDIEAQIANACPDGIDVYFDNVGGETLSACLEHLAMNARIALCGSISEYLLDEPYGLTNYTRLRRSNATMKGFFIYNYEQDFDKAESELGGWVEQGLLKPVEYVVDGFEQMPDALATLYDGRNTGVTLCRVRCGPHDNQKQQ